MQIEIIYLNYVCSVLFGKHISEIMNYIKTTVSGQQLQSCFYDHRKVIYSSIYFSLLEFLNLRCVRKLCACLRINISLIRKMHCSWKKKEKRKLEKNMDEEIKRKRKKRRSKRRKRGKNLFFIMNFQGYVTF